MTFDSPATYRVAYLAAWVVTIAMVVLSAISTVAALLGVDVLGINPTVSAWLLVASTALGAVQGLLPRITTPQSRTELKAQAFSDGQQQVAQIVTGGTLPPPPIVTPGGTAP